MPQIRRVIYNISSKILPSDVKRTAGILNSAVKNGYQKGKRCSNINHYDSFERFYAPAKSVTKELRKVKISREELPALLASIMLILPVPATTAISPFVYGLGKLINKTINLTKNLSFKKV